MHVVIFEGSQWGAFAPLSLGRPVFALVTGASSLLEKQLRHLQPKRLTLWVRPEMEAFCRARIIPHLSVPTQLNQPLDDEPALLFNGRVVHLASFELPPENAVVVDEGETIRLAYCRRPGLGPQDAFGRTQRWLDLLELPHTMPQARLVDSLWDLIHWNDESLVEDFAHLHDRPAAPVPAGPFHVLSADNLWLGPDVKLAPGCVLDASRGPIMIGGGATVGANAVVNGPCWIGPSARVRPLTQVREGSSIGAGCTVGGEISHSIFLDYSNKAHEGYIGHSYVGKWVNLGSGTTTSNLKNTYGEVRARVGSREVATGRQFLGSVIGDHAKTAVLTRLGAGTYVGFGSMIASGGTAPRLVPSYTFLTDRGAEPYDLSKAMEVARRVFARRDRPFEQTDEQLMRYVAQVAPTIERGELRSRS
jgi:UDP-N-acetylglucosamine diphosphorylase / glucose-1-phosphate thymidylyltransferase / UDP-N-acetylgalactosamine diphosphorylase / glucosamine-1-phosphate N-acetyltransferase / galactosamine-1-phosphate N-acetyltransferase